jgi:hypothetical protein
MKAKLSEPNVPCHDPVELGERLSALREAQGLTLNQAIAMFANGSTIDRWVAWEQGFAADRNDLEALESVLIDMTKSSVER